MVSIGDCLFVSKFTCYHTLKIESLHCVIKLDSVSKAVGNQLPALGTAELYSEPCQTSKRELFAKVVNGLQS